MASIFDAVQTNQQNVPISPAASAFSSSVNTFSATNDENTLAIPAVNNITISTFSDHQKIKSAQRRFGKLDFSFMDEFNNASFVCKNF